ncbi:MAG: hypothetical protein CMA64_10280 [Euryarchaeota archaeon]|jgi:subtilisin family serine protease|nr:hypothetical protein [Euryarchaeota archaeon]
MFKFKSILIIGLVFLLTACGGGGGGTPSGVSISPNNTTVLSTNIQNNISAIDHALETLTSVNGISATSVDKSKFKSMKDGFEAIKSLKTEYDSLSSADKLILANVMVQVDLAGCKTGSGAQTSCQKSMALSEVIDFGYNMYTRYYEPYQNFWTDGATTGYVDETSSEFASIKARVEADELKSRDDLVYNVNEGSDPVKTGDPEHVIVEYTEDKKIVVSTGSTRTVTIKTETVTYSAGTVSDYWPTDFDETTASGCNCSKTYTNKYTATETYNTHRIDTITYKRTDTKHTWTDGKVTTEYGEPTVTKTVTGDVVETDVVQSNFNTTSTLQNTTSNAVTETSQESIVVPNYDVVEKVIISTDGTRIKSTYDSTVVEVTGTVTKTYTDTYQITTTYSSYREDTVTYKRTDTKINYSDGTSKTITGTAEKVSTVTGNVVEHDVTDSEPVRTARVLVSTVDSNSVAYTDSDENLGTKTTGYSNNANDFLDSETRAYCGSSYSACSLDSLTVFTDDNLANGTGTSFQHIAEAGINDAWARGWTGKGVNVGIIDTGVNINHDELDGQIGGVYNNGSTDWDGHGSHVAGTIVAKKDGKGTVGVAFDSKLYVVRETGLNYNKEEYWNYFKENNVDVVNVSINGRWDYNVTFDDSYVVGSDVNNQNDTYKSLSLIDGDKNLYKWNKTLFQNGSYHNVNTKIAMDDDGNIFYGGIDSIEALSTYMSGSEIIFVNSAGNQGYSVAATPGWYATVTDDNGDLMLDGRMIIVGSYDPASGTNNSYSNGAGHICREVVNDVCQDDYTVSDFYIRAPEAFTSLDNVGNGYIDMSGTSMAAPVVTGSIALVRQMWPHMTGANTVKLILQTADKSYDGYDVGVDGQGRLDMDKATQPVGAVGIPTDGRTTGNTISSTGYIAGGSSIPNEVSSLIVEIDEASFNREWLVPIAEAHVNIDTAFHSFTNYAGMTTIGTNDFALHLTENDTNKIAVTLDGTTFGYIKEEGQYLGKYFNGMFDIGETQTAFLQKGNTWQTGGNTWLSANVNLGYTQVDTVGHSLINNSDDLLSYGWSTQIDHNVDENWSLTSFVAQPVSVFSGSMNINAPTSRSGDNVSYTNTAYNQAVQTETDLGITAKFVKENFNFSIGGVSRFNTVNGDTYNVTTSVGWKF